MSRPRRNLRSDALALRFGQNVRRSRHQAALSQEELAERASLHRTEIGMVEHGQRVVRIDTLIRLAGAMAIPPGDLLEGIQWSVGEPERDGGFSFTSAPQVAGHSKGDARPPG